MTSNTPAFESLEPRLQFAAAAPFAARINFAPNASPLARGYIRDYGPVYTPHRNGLTYGWNHDRQSAAVYTPSRSYPDPHVESNIKMSIGDSWQIAVPNGYYKVHALLGQPGLIAGDYRLDVEGKIFVKGEPYNGYAFIEGYTTIQVTDGKLTLTPDARAVDDRLTSIEITQVAKPTATPAGHAIAWSRSSVTVPLARVESVIARSGNLLYTLGGFVNNYEDTTQRFDVMNIKTHVVTRLADLPGAQTHQGVAIAGRYIYVAGGQYGPERSTTLTDQVWRYDTVRNTWKAFGKLPSNHLAAQMVYINGKLHYLGGDGTNRVVAQTTHWVLDLANPGAGWKNAAPLPSPSDHATAFAANGVIYYIGGDNEHGTSYLSQSGVYAYDPSRNKWATFASLPIGTSHIEASTLTDGKNIFVVAGQEDAQQLTSNVFTYNIASNVWTQNTSMPTARKGGVAYLLGDKIYYLSGDDMTFGLQTWGYVGVIQP